MLLLDPRRAQDSSFSQLVGVGVEIAEQLVAATIDAATEDDCAPPPPPQFKTAGRAVAVFTWMCSVNWFCLLRSSPRSLDRPAVQCEFLLIGPSVYRRPGGAAKFLSNSARDLDT